MTTKDQNIERNICIVHDSAWTPDQSSCAFDQAYGRGGIECVRPEFPPPICRHCDGTGWNEGTPATTCFECNGSGSGSGEADDE